MCLYGMSQEHFEEKTPCQAVSNKLDLEVAPRQLQNLRKLEKLLISKRIFLKKSCSNSWKRKICK